jgi:BirA family biotin operon repressor/biotin-[acetyl-CoA-carboxylase] ligase
MKAKILNILRSRNEIAFDEKLSAAVGISKAAVLKHIHELQDLGYQIVTTSKGYRLHGSPDILYPWEYPGNDFNIRYYPQVTSTMTVARDLARKDCPDMTLVLAGRQTRGRGRLNRRWLSDDGGIYFTMVLRPQIEATSSFKINFLASLALAQVIREMLQVEAMVKWPNDILAGEHKISGMLSEMEAVAGRVSFINIGMGINVNNNPFEAEPKATSLRMLCGREVSRKDLLIRFLNQFGDRIRNRDFEDVVSEWKRYTLTLGRQVRIVTQREEVHGLAVDVDENGALVLEHANGGQKKIIYGDCFLV